MSKTGKSSSRNVKTRVKTAKGRSNSSARWLQRQLNDPYVQQSKQDGYRSRAAYKLLEMNEKLHILKPGQTVVDLGAAPGSWAQIASDEINKGQKGKVIAIDLLEIDPLAGVEFLQADFTAPESTKWLKNHLPKGADVVLSDMAPNTTGNNSLDHLRIVGLCEEVFLFASEVLRPGGSLICKVFQGGTEQALLKQLRAQYAKVKHVKPKASRKESAELYVVATGFKG